MYLVLPPKLLPCSFMSSHSVLVCCGEVVLELGVGGFSLCLCLLEGEGGWGGWFT